MSSTITSVRPSVNENGEPGPLQWTREMYYRAAETGVFDGRRVQLIKGEIYDMAPQGIDHAVAIEQLTKKLTDVFAKGYRVRIQLPVQAANNSEPEPDAAVIAGTPRGQKDHPRNALLLVEVADTTLHLDRTVKAPLYAEMGVVDYWIVNLIARKVEVHRKPMQDVDGTWRYGDVHIAGVGEVLTPLAAPEANVAVTDLLP